MIVLDTHIWHWWINQIPGKLSPEIITLIEATALHYLISKNLQPMRNTYRLRLSGRDCRNPEAKDGVLRLHSCSLDTGNPCRYDDFLQIAKVSCHSGYFMTRIYSVLIPHFLLTVN